MNLENFQGVQHILGVVNDLDTVVAQTATVDLYNNDLLTAYAKKYRQWITSTQLNTIKGLEQFETVGFSNGTTEAFDKFRIRHRNKRLRVLHDEYLYHKLYLGAENITSLSSLAHGDAVIISAPYARTGEIHPIMSDLLCECDAKDIPVLIDCAYYGLCGNLTFDFDHPCIEDIAFSLSKVFGTSYYRIGIRFSRNTTDSLADFGANGYVNRLAAAIGCDLLDRYDPDYLYTTYRSTQVDFCEQLSIAPSSSVIFGIDTASAYQQQPRPDELDRFCLSKYLVQGHLP